jgi:hypothetical protein
MNLKIVLFFLVRSEEHAHQRDAISQGTCSLGVAMSRHGYQPDLLTNTPATFSFLLVW